MTTKERIEELLDSEPDITGREISRRVGVSPQRVSVILWKLGKREAGNTTRICLVCRAPIPRGAGRTYCSKQCRKEAYSEWIICAMCGQHKQRPAYELRRNPRATRYCSRQCSMQATGKANRKAE